MNETESDREKQRSIECANAYREMTQSWAWKDLRGRIAHIVEISLSLVDDMDIKDLTVALVAESRGVRKAFQQMQSEIDFILGENL